ncbi:hypothetical protein EVAR_24726_1 [Eumeta japonica]|uniref:Uncharacterized protein n=1 Tax=Eumeta variegata TaxID=151549 RepID=A0A4C1VDM1_EUMVA|nr:hypothetical protein EVAR_24726_1 [Eumeta japonica]
MSQLRVKRKLVKHGPRGTARAAVCTTGPLRSNRRTKSAPDLGAAEGMNFNFITGTVARSDAHGEVSHCPLPPSLSFAIIITLRPPSKLILTPEMGKALVTCLGLQVFVGGGD